MTRKRLHEQVRVAYVKVAEYQRRGLVHLHALIRLDRAMPEYRKHELRPPSGRFTTELLEEAIRTSAREADAPLPAELGGGRVRWGGELHVCCLDAHERHRVAGYLAKYATKSTEQAGGVLHRVTRERSTSSRSADHVRRYLRAAFVLDDHARAAASEQQACAGATTLGPVPETSRDPNRLAGARSAR